MYRILANIKVYNTGQAQSIGYGLKSGSMTFDFKNYEVIGK